jgi:hypothetical protein
MGREPQIYVAVGRRGIGKTKTTVDKIRAYVRGNPARGVPGRPVLIFDVNNEFSDKSKFPDIRTISLRDVPLFSARRVPEIRRIAPFFDTGQRIRVGPDMVGVLEWLLDNFTNGLLLIEDINKYVSDNMSKDLVGAICTNRHIGVDVILHYQSIGRVSTKVWQNIDTLRMHKETAGVERNRGKFEEHYDLFKLAENIVNNEFEAGNKYFYLTVDVANKMIHADVPVERMKDAIAEFVWQDNPRIISRTLNQYDRNSGKRMFSNENDAYRHLERTYLKTYFGKAA